MAVHDTSAMRRRHRIRELSAACLRALSRDPGLDLLGVHAYRGTEALPLNAPHLYPGSEALSFTSFRGASDGMALRVLHSDAALHRELLPEDESSRLVFEMLEQFRCESLVTGLPGVVANLRARHVDWSMAYLRSGLAETSLGLLLYTIALVCRSRITGEPLVEESEDLIEGTRFGLAASLGPLLPPLRASRHDQRRFADAALAVAELTADRVAALEGPNPSARRTRERQRTGSGFSLVFDVAAGTGTTPTAEAGTSSTLDAARGSYRAFTTAYDQVLPASSLARRQTLDTYREQVVRRVHAEAVNVQLLARRLQGLLCVPERSGWSGGQEEGHLDGSRLSQLVCSPTERRLFRVEEHEPQAAATVAFLLDCSGSMKVHGESLAAFLDVMVRALERIDVSSEVLGYTTGAWNGGRSARDWRRAGRPNGPGRLNELNHLVFKDAGTGWRAARTGMAALLKQTIFREGVDGEAVQWAHSRLRRHDAGRRILLVISDGSPSDSATAEANDRAYLQHHLMTAVRAVETSGETAVVGVGVGLDMSPYFGNSVILDPGHLGGTESLRDLLAALGRAIRPAGR